MMGEAAVLLGPDWREWLDRVARDPENAHIGRFSRFNLRLRADEEEGSDWLLHYDHGRLNLGEIASQAEPGVDRVDLSGPAEAWCELRSSSAAPRRHDLLALLKADQGLRVEAGYDSLLRHLRVIDRLIGLLKEASRTMPEPAWNVGEPRMEAAIGRYILLTSGGVRYRVYFEEAGNGPVLLALHTAGADGRQFRHLLADPEVNTRHRVVVPDLPWHGKSLPPDEWWMAEYLLTTDAYAEFVRDFVEALGLSDPVVLGCSMAGSLVIELARRDPDRWRAVIGISGALVVKGRFHDWPLAPDLNAQQIVPTWTSSLMSPHSPEGARRESWWIYSQGGPGIYRGDTYFYSEDFDLRETAATIDTGRCPVYLLTGEYDHACTPADTEAAIAAIPGARGGIMPGIGHFPMTENYPRFRTHLLPILQRVASGMDQSGSANT